MGSSPFVLRLFTYEAFLGRPPEGFLFHPQGSSWFWTFPVTTNTADPDVALVLEQEVS